MQRRIKGAMLHLQNFIGALLNGVGNGVSVGRSDQQGLEHEEIESSLKNLTLQRVCATFGHGELYSTRSSSGKTNFPSLPFGYRSYSCSLRSEAESTR